MGYSKSKDTVKKKESQAILKLLLEFKDESEFKVPTALPTKLASRCRELLAIIEESPKSFPEFVDLVGKFSFHVNKDSIIVRRKHQLVSGTAERITPEGLGVAESLVIPECRTALEIVGAAIKHKANVMVFPDATKLDSVALMDIYKWTSKNGYYGIINEDNFTLSRTESPEREKWQPFQ